MVKRKRNDLEYLLANPEIEVRILRKEGKKTPNSSGGGTEQNETPSPTTVTSIFNDAVQACSRTNVPSMKDLNEYAKMKYKIDLEKNLMHVKRITRRNQICSSQMNRLTRLKSQTKDTKTSIQNEKEELKKESQKGETYQDLLALDNVDLIPNAQKIECPVCLQNVDIEQGATLQDCLHSFCKKCLVTAIEISQTALVRCPFQNSEYLCESHLQEREVKALVPSQVYEKYLQRSIIAAEIQDQHSFHCKTPNCPGWCVLGENVFIFECPVCMHTNCLICAAIHEGQTCQEYQAVVLFRCNSNKETEKNQYILQAESNKISEKECNDKDTYVHLLALDDVNLVDNTEKFDCPICFSDIDVGQGVTLQDCLHSFCKECLVGVVQFSETAFVKCPFQNDAYSCESHLQDREIKALVPLEIYEKYLQKSVTLAENQASNSFHCKTPDCPGWCFIEDDANFLICPVCKHLNCLTCSAIHEGKNCRQYQDDLIFRCDSNEEARRTQEYLQNVLNEGKAMRCPQCQIVLMKKEGCDWLKCSMCHTEICWITKGPRWGPKGFLDTSGGCRCKVNGKLCHPKCKNCH